MRENQLVTVTYSNITLPAGCVSYLNSFFPHEAQKYSLYSCANINYYKRNMNLKFENSLHNDCHFNLDGLEHICQFNLTLERQRNTTK